MDNIVLQKYDIFVYYAFIRPAPGSANRKLWNLFHWNLGCLTLASGVINCFIGALVYHRQSSTSVGAWYVAGGVLVAFWAVLEVVLSLLGWRHRAKEEPKAPMSDIEVSVVMPVAHTSFEFKRPDQDQPGLGARASSESKRLGAALGARASSEYKRLGAALGARASSEYKRLESVQDQPRPGARASSDYKRLGSVQDQPRLGVRASSEYKRLGGTHNETDHV